MSILGLYKPSLHHGTLGLLDGAHRHLQEEKYFTEPVDFYRPTVHIFVWCVLLETTFVIALHVLYHVSVGVVYQLVPPKISACGYLGNKRML